MRVAQHAKGDGVAHPAARVRRQGVRGGRALVPSESAVDWRAHARAAATLARGGTGERGEAGVHKLTRHGLGAFAWCSTQGGDGVAQPSLLRVTAGREGRARACGLLERCVIGRTAKRKRSRLGGARTCSSDACTRWHGRERGGGKGARTSSSDTCTRCHERRGKVRAHKLTRHGLSARAWRITQWEDGAAQLAAREGRREGRARARGLLERSVIGHTARQTRSRVKGSRRRRSAICTRWHERERGGESAQAKKEGGTPHSLREGRA
eukprot:799589-Pleurochrysis_carterae.AAC.5